jgi:CheY-like chemotaxis protein
MKQQHVALIVEDDPATAEDLVEIIHSIDCTGIVVDNSEEALRAFESQSYCFVLLDLNIKGDADAIKGHVEHGKSLLRKIRQTHGVRNGSTFWLPVIVLSGHAREADDAVEVMKDGASDVIQKPLSQQVSERIRRTIEASGRERHDLCHEPPSAKPPNIRDDIVIAIPGERVGRRSLVTVGSTAVKLTDGALKVLLHLMVARREGTWLSKIALGAEPDEGFKGISRLTEQLGPALADRKIIENDYRGNYRLTADVTVGECRIDKLDEIGDTTISALAATLQKV